MGWGRRAEIPFFFTEWAEYDNNKMKRVLNWTHACVCGTEPGRQSQSRPRSSRMPVESAGEPVSLPAKAACTGSEQQRAICTP